MGHVLMENRNGLAIDATLTHATGTAEREAALAMLDRRRTGRRITLGADKAYDVTSFVGDLRARKVAPYLRGQRRGLEDRHDPQDRDGRAHAAPCRYQISQRIRKRSRKIFGWIKKPGGLAKAKVRGKTRVDAVFTFTVIAYNLIGSRSS